MVMSCSEEKLDLYDVSINALNIAKGSAFGNTVNYPDSITFNAYFLGGDVKEYRVEVPVRLQGIIDYENDRSYYVDVVDSASVGVELGKHFIFEKEQTFRKGLSQDTISLIINIDNMDEEQNYRLRLALVPNENFSAGIPVYQYMDIIFTKNLSIAPNLWNNNSKLRKLTYSPRKCAVFLQISGITDPDWTDDGTTGILEYWINLCIQWFEEHPEYDESGNRIFFNE